MLNAGDSFGGFEIIQELGRGGMGVVYRARQRSLDRLVALKVLAPHLASDVSFRERFRREAITAARLRHPSIVTVFEAGETEGQLFLAMELVDGTTMAQLIGSPALTYRTTVRLLTPIAHALDRAHAAGLVHRDIKPQNILIGRDGGVYLADFGVAKSLDTTAATARGQFLGSVNYASPEQIKGDKLTGASDRYALGVVLYEALTGHLPFERESSPAVMLSHLNDTPPAPSSLREDLPAELDDVLAKALSKQPEDRYDSAVGLVETARDALPAETVDEQATIAVRDVVPPPNLGAWEDLGVTTKTQAVPTPTLSFPEDRARRRKRIALVAAAVTAVAGAGVAGAVVIGTDDHDPSIQSVLAPVDRENKRLSATFNSLAVGHDVSVVHAASTRSIRVLRNTERAVADLEDSVAHRADVALNREIAILVELSKLSPATDLDELEKSADRLDEQIAALEPPIALARLDIDSLVGWWGDRTENRRFLDRVDTIIQASRPARTSLREMETGIRQRELDLEQVREILTTVIDNRRDRVSNVNALNPPNDQTEQIKDLLARSFFHSLELNRDFRDALPAEPVPDVHGFLLEQYENSYGQSDAVSEAKGAVVTAYNRLASQLGLKRRLKLDF